MLTKFRKISSIFVTFRVSCGDAEQHNAKPFLLQQKMKRKVKLRVTKVFRRQIVSTTSSSGACQVCRNEQGALSVAKSAALLRIEISAVEFLVTSGKLHWAKNTNGDLEICNCSREQTCSSRSAATI